MKLVIGLILVVVMAFLGAAFICYICGALSEGSFDISHWTKDTRDGVMFGSIMVTILCLP